MPNQSEGSAATTGLTQAEAQARFQSEGPNELPRPDRRTLSRIIFDVLREPMLSLLMAGGAIYLILGDLQEAVILLVFATLSVVITVVQETRTERVLEALRDLTSPRALVIRDGERKRVAGRDVVRGDLVVLAEGDRVPADAILLECDDLQTDESLLTGESVPVRKGRAGLAPRRNRLSRAATIYRLCFPARWSCAAQASARSWRPVQGVKLARSASHSACSNPKRRGCRSSHAGWSQHSLSPAAPSVPWRSCSMASCAGHG